MVDVKAKPLTPGKGKAITESGGKTEAKEPLKGTLDVRVLKAAAEFTVVFHDGKGMTCQLVDADNYNLVVSSGGKKLLIPKHSVKYILLGMP